MEPNEQAPQQPMNEPQPPYQPYAPQPPYQPYSPQPPYQPYAPYPPYTPQPPYPPYPPTEAPPQMQPAEKPLQRNRRTAEKRDLVFAVITAMLCVLCVDFYLWGGAGLAATLSTVALFLTGTCYLWRKRRALTFYGGFCAVAYLGCALSLCLTGSPKILSIMAMFILSAVAMLELMQLRRHRDGSFRSVGDVCYLLFVLSFGKIGNLCYALFHGRDNGGAPRGRKVGSIFLGLLISLPVLALLIPLLMSSDAAFSSLVEQMNTQSASEILCAVIVGAALFLLLFGRLFALPEVKRAEPAVPSERGVPIGILLSFLSAISAVYLLYLFSQFAYFFSAFSGLLPRDFTVAEYARRGFFEMTVICIINLALVFAVNLISPKEKQTAPLSVRLFSLFLCVFSLLLAATSASKILLYVDSFGMTRLRIYTLVFIVFLTVVLLCVIVRLFRKSVPYMKLAVVAAAVLFLGSAFYDVDRMIASYNVGSYQSGRLESIDMDTLADLPSDAVVPYLLELTQDPSETIATQARALLSRRADAIFEITASGGNVTIHDKDADWRAWNLTSARTEQLLKERFAEYYVFSAAEP